MKAFPRTLLIVITVLCFVAKSTFANLITFDDLSGTAGVISNGYNGLSWQSFQFLNAAVVPNPSGYLAGIISPGNVAFNAAGDPAQLGGGGIFSLHSAYLTAAWRDNLNVQVIGLLGGVVVYNNNYTLSATTPSLIDFNYVGIDTVRFSSSGGTAHSGYAGSGTQFVMDNLTIDSFDVPDSGSTLMLLGAGLLGLIGLRGFEETDRLASMFLIFHRRRKS